MIRFRELARTFFSCRSGTIVIKFALLSPVLLVMLGSAVDFGMIQHRKSVLQAATDAGSIAAAKELGLSDFRSENVEDIVLAVIERYMQVNNPSAYRAGEILIEAAVQQDPLQVDVTATQSTSSALGGLGLGIDEITVRAVARVVGRPNVCVLGLDPSEGGTISLEQRALVTANDCAVFSNSDHRNSIKAKNSATLKASLICTRGGKDGNTGSFSPEPLTDCPGFEDPLGDRPEPAVGSCIETDRIVSGETVTLVPGTYCGGLTITAASTVTLEPGVYVIKDGPLLVEGDSSLAGERVGFFFSGEGARFEFVADSSISLSAPTDGAMAGLLMFEGRNQSTAVVHNIESDDARKLLGTIYLPRGELRIAAESPVADQSAYTAIVARAMRLYGGPHLVLNTNYDLTPVPVPEGIKGADQPVTLVR